MDGGSELEEQIDNGDLGLLLGKKSQASEHRQTEHRLFKSAGRVWRCVVLKVHKQTSDWKH